jgi:hypothetical protein
MRFVLGIELPIIGHSLVGSRECRFLKLFSRNSLVETKIFQGVRLDVAIK